MQKPIFILTSTWLWQILKKYTSKPHEMLVGIPTRKVTPHNGTVDWCKTVNPVPWCRRVHSEELILELALHTS